LPRLETMLVRVIPMSIKTYSELITLSTFEDRFEYLNLKGRIGEETFGFDRYLNQIFYRSQKWKTIRNYVILRDNGCDLGLEGYEIYGKIIIHHMNPITIKDIERDSDFLLNPEFLICTTHNTHNAIHYGDKSLLMTGPIVRTKNDTCPWRH
jgi:hypothetical protein